ncbi:hypothetical protein FRC04_005188 [Tulasnella sp. 424]|nr:hypothetical protein FRC04_005188 [Tulasnella sp. 424]
MTTVAAVGALHQIPFGVPDPPREFGQDGGRFYRLYDNLAEEIDDDMTKGLKEQLDGLLIFAGLFAGVNSAFLALTLPLLSADPADDTNALLAQNNAILMQLMQGRNDTGLGNSTLPSTSFSPSHGIFTVNVLFSFSLTLAIISSFLAVLGRQWLVYYRKRSGGGPDRQRWEQLKRFLGAERWRLDLRRHRSYNPSSDEFNIGKSLKKLHRSLFRGYFTMSTLRGPKNEIIFLQVVALKRTICTSDDPLTLLCATANIFTIDEPRYLEGLWSDEMFHSRFLELCTNPYQRIVQLLGRDRDEAAISAARLYRGALCHIFLSLDPADRHWRLLDGEVPQDILKAIMSEPLIDSSWLIQPDMVDGCSPALIEAALASWMLRACVEYVPVERIGSHLTEYSDSLSISSWKLVSLIVYILTRFPHPGGWTEIIEDGPQPFHSSPKRYDTVGSVMTTGPPLFTQPFIQPISTGQPGRPVFIDQSGQPIFTSQPVPPFGTGQPVQPMIWTGQPVPPFGTGQSVQPMIYTGQPVQPFITGQSVQPVFTGQPGQPISTGQPVLPFEFVTGQPGQPIFTGQPGQLVFDGQPGQPIVTGHPVPPFITGQPGQRVITGQPGQPISTSQPGQPFIIGQPGQPIVVGQSAPSFITGQPVPPNFTGQSGQSVITGQPGRPVLTGQPGQPIFIGRSVPPLITNEPVPQFKFVEGVSIDEPGGSVAVRIDPFRQPNFTGQPVYPFITVQSGQPMFSPLRRSRSYTGQIHEVSIDVNDMITRSGPPVLNIAELRSAYTR